VSADERERFFGRAISRETYRGAGRGTVCRKSSSEKEVAFVGE